MNKQQEKAAWITGLLITEIMALDCIDSERLNDNPRDKEKAEADLRKTLAPVNKMVLALDGIANARWTETEEDEEKLAQVKQMADDTVSELYPLKDFTVVAEVDQIARRWTKAFVVTCPDSIQHTRVAVQVAIDQEFGTGNATLRSITAIIPGKHTVQIPS